jgi:broad specificity phosphatase PhoE
MPLPNEHSVRIKSPGKYDKFRRVNDKLGKGKDAIYGIKNGKAELQAVRFDKKKYSIEDVKAWAKDHPHISISPASDHSGMTAGDISVRVPVKNVSVMDRQGAQSDPQSLPDTDTTSTLENAEQHDLGGISYGNQTPIPTPAPQYGMQRMIPSIYGAHFSEAMLKSKQFFVRHGTTALNEASEIRGWSDPELSTQGRHEAVKVAKSLRTKSIKQIYSSDLVRASDTAKAIAFTTSAPIITTPNLRPWDLGDFTGKNSNDVVVQLKPYIEDPDKQVPGGESFNEFKNRFCTYYNHITDSNYGDPIVIVAHHRNDRLLDSMVGDDIDFDTFSKEGIDPGSFREIDPNLPYVDSEVDPEELELGQEHEMEHTTDPEEAKKYALDHLKKIPDYYTRLNIMEQTQEKETKAKADLSNISNNNAEGINHADYVLEPNIALGVQDMDQLSKDATVTQIPANIKADVTGQLQAERDAELYNEGSKMDDTELKEGSWVEAFKEGTHTDADGISRKWEPKDIDTIAQQYNSATAESNPNRHIAPVVIGHPKDNSPAVGWIEKAKSTGGKLMLKMKELHPDFVEALKKGMYKTRSISLYPDLNIRHIGFLGGAVPAVKGLGPFKFHSEEKALTYEFAEGSFEDEDVNEMKQELGFFRKLMNTFKIEINKYTNHAEGTSSDLQAADVLTQGTSDIRQEGATMAESVNTNAGAIVGQSGTGNPATTPAVEGRKDESEKTISGAPQPQTKAVPVKDVKDTKDENTELAQELSEMKDKLAKAEAECNRLQTLVDEAQKSDAMKSFREFAEGLVASGKLLPRDVEQTALNIKLRSEMDLKTASDFAEKKTDTITNYVEEYKEYLQSLPSVLDYSELVTKTNSSTREKMAEHSEKDTDDDGDCNYVEKKIKNFMKADAKMSYSEAFTKLSQEEPEAVQKHLMDSFQPIVSGNI